MERASVRRLPRPDRTVQTTLPAAAARIVRAEQSAAARVRIRLPVELQGSEFDCRDRKSTRLNSSHANISYAVFCLKKKMDRNKVHSPPLTHRHERKSSHRNEGQATSS